MTKRKLTIVAGPTAVGKSAYAVRLAKEIGGEIISGDSMQVYRGMDIGSAKITAQEMDGVPHHLIDAIAPTERWNVARFVTMAKTAMEDIYSRGKTPIVCGGTGFYLHALAYDNMFAEEETDAALRRELEAMALTEEGKDALFEKLKALDPSSAESIHPNNTKRVIRAIEYAMDTGDTMSRLNAAQKAKESPYELTYLILDMPRERLYERINQRVDQMIEKGLENEVRALLAQGVRADMTSMQGLGYKEMLPYLAGEKSLEDVVYLIKRDTRHFAKRQMTWFRHEPNTTIIPM